MNEDVLHTDRNPTARFAGKATPKGDGYTVNGELELAGQKQPLAFDVAKQNGGYQGEIEIQPSRWGVDQYKAMLGAIRLKDQVKIRFALSDA
jgi:polyisoprenoid-binding protein YceI